MADEDRAILQESARPEDVVGMDMAHHHIFDRRIGLLPDRRAQIFAIREAAARVGDEDALASNDEADVGDGVVIGGARVLIDAAADMDALSDLVGGERAGRGERPPQGSRQAAEAKAGLRDAAACIGAELKGILPDLLCGRIIAGAT